jgi:hypothetical protein
LVRDIRTCEQCGARFEPRSEHARFCSARCRAAWNRELAGDLDAAASALQWSITAMSDTTQRLTRVRARDRPRGFTVIGEAVWWVTIVDATLVRHHPEAYDRVLAGHDPAERKQVEGTLAGLRFVRNRIGGGVDLAEFIHPQASRPAPRGDRTTAWTWKPAPEPELASLSPRAQAWEKERYRAYQAQLAGHTVGQAFGRAVVFLEAAAAKATSLTDIHARVSGERR